IFITLGGQHANGLGLSELLSALGERQEQGYIELQRREWAPDADVPTRSHHEFSGVPYHHLLGTAYDAARLGTEFAEKVSADKVGGGRRVGRGPASGSGLAKGDVRSRPFLVGDGEERPR